MVNVCGILEQNHDGSRYIVAHRDETELGQIPRNLKILVSNLNLPFLGKTSETITRMEFLDFYE